MSDWHWLIEWFCAWALGVGFGMGIESKFGVMRERKRLLRRQRGREQLEKKWNKHFPDGDPDWMTNPKTIDDQEDPDA